MLTGVMGGADMLTFIPLGLAELERQPELMEWVNFWWGSGDALLLTTKG
jgi:hypothetical protein